MNFATPLNIARVLVVVGLIIGLESLYQTFNHIGDPLFRISPEHPGGADHAWYHCLRELLGDIATIIILLTVFFGKEWFRTPAAWWLALIAHVGYVLPFWAGMPFNSSLAAPDLEAEIRHILQAVLPLAGIFIARKEFFKETAAA